MSWFRTQQAKNHLSKRQVVWEYAINNVDTGVRVLLGSDFGNELVYAVCETALADQAVPHLNQTMKNDTDFFLSTGDVILHRFHRDRLLCYNHIKESGFFYDATGCIWRFDR